MKIVTITLRPIPPFRLDLTAWALRRRPHNLIDQWDGKQYTRVLQLNNKPMKAAVHQTGPPARPMLHVIVSGKWEIPDSEMKLVIRKHLKKILGLQCDLQGFYDLALKDKILMPLAERFRGVKPPRFPTIFEALINALACQQLSLHVGIVLLNRLTQSYGLSFKEGETNLFAFPRPRDLCRAKPEDLRQLGFSFHKSNSIIGLSRRIVDGELDLIKLETLDEESTSEYLEGIKGIGRWSSEYVRLRGLGRIDLFPGDDVGAQRNLQKILGTKRRLDYEKTRNITGRWYPYAGMVYFHLLLHNLEKQGYLQDLGIKQTLLRH